MQGKEKMIEEIVGTARKTAVAMVDEATEESKNTLDALRQSLSDDLKHAAEETRELADREYAGRVKLGELEAGKVMLKAKQAAVSEVYDSVRARIISLSDAEYLKLLAKLIASVCEDGDEIVSCKRDAKRVTSAWVKKLSASTKKKLTLSAEKGDFDGGVILRNARFDRDLTVDEIVSELKERTLSDTAKKLGI